MSFHNQANKPINRFLSTFAAFDSLSFYELRALAIALRIAIPIRQPDAIAEVLKEKVQKHVGLL
jgi:hypothetical protein